MITQTDLPAASPKGILSMELAYILQLSCDAMLGLRPSCAVCQYTSTRTTLWKKCSNFHDIVT